MENVSEKTEQKQPSFEGEFQGKVAALCLRDTIFMQQVDGLIRPEYFEDSDVGMTVDVVQRYFKKYKKAFGDLVTFKSYVKTLIDGKIVKREAGMNILKQAFHLWKFDISDREFVVDTVSKFARHAAVSNAILQVVEKHLDYNNFDTIQKVLTKALQVGAYGDSIGYNYGEGIEARTDERIAKEKGEAEEDGVTTGYPELDEHLLPHRGWGKRELSVLMGPAKIGKSTALMDFGLSACAKKHNVLYVTLEVSQKIISERADAHIANIATHELQKRNQTVKMAVQNWRSKSGLFIVEERPTGTMQVSDIKRILDKWKTQGVTFDLVVVDYADLMKPEIYNPSPIENSRTIWLDLRGLASSENIAVLTATQTNREGAKKMVATMTDVAEDFNKIRIADTVISLNKTEEEVMRNECRLYMVALRNAPSGFSVRVKQNISCMHFVTQVMGIE